MKSIAGGKSRRPAYERLVFSSALGTLLVLQLAPVANAASLLEVTQNQRAIVTVDTETVVRSELPRTLFGFNINHYFFEQDLWQTDKKGVNPQIIDALQPFDGALYRYPGGLVADRFAWEQAVGPAAQRLEQRAMAGGPPRRVQFGVQEYLNFVKSVGGRPLYVLNLVGWDRDSMIHELPQEEVARSNARLASFMKDQPAASSLPRYYELGNELDRADYQWSYDKYIERAGASIDAIRAVDADARFIAFLREFDWTYTGAAASRGTSRYQDFISAVLKGLPSVNDFSMHFYYDDPGDSRVFKQIPWRLRQFQRAIDVAATHRNRSQLGVWITEHARGISSGSGKASSQADLTSNLSAALSTADFLIALAQIPEVRGANWHGLNAGPWQLFDATISKKDLSPRPVYWGMRVLRTMDLPIVLDTRTQSPNLSKYAGGYDIRAAAFTDTSRGRLGLLVVNRASAPQEVEVAVKSWENLKVSIAHRYLAGADGVDPEDPGNRLDIHLDPKISKAAFSKGGILKLTLPSSSVSSFLMTREP